MKIVLTSISMITKIKKKRVYYYTLVNAIGEPQTL